MALLKNMAENVLRPIFVNVATATILFLFALAFKDNIIGYFRGDEIPEYPLKCFAEPYKGNSDYETKFDFFIVNTTGDDLTDKKLESRLAEIVPSLLLSPKIEVRFLESFGKVLEEIEGYEDKDFNKGKGDLHVIVDRETNVVEIHVRSIKPWSILKADIRTVSPFKVSDFLERSDWETSQLQFKPGTSNCYSQLVGLR